MKMTKTIVIDRLIKGGFNKDSAKSMVKECYNDVERIYKGQNLTPKKFADIVSTMYCL